MVEQRGLAEKRQLSFLIAKHEGKFNFFFLPLRKKKFVDKLYTFIYSLSKVNVKDQRASSSMVRDRRTQGNSQCKVLSNGAQGWEEEGGSVEREQ